MSIRRAFARGAVGWVHLVSNDHMSHLSIHDTQESAMAYIEWDTAQYGHRNANAYLKYRGTMPITHHTDKGPTEQGHEV